MRRDRTPKAERMQDRERGHGWIVRQCIPQRQGSVCVEFDDESVRQRLGSVIFRGFALWFRRAVDDDCSLRLGTRWLRSDWLGSGLRSPGICLDLLDWWFVFGPDVTALNPKLAFGVNADEGPRARGLDGIVNNATFLELGEGRLDLAQTVVNLLGQFVRTGIFLFEFIEFAPQGLPACVFFASEIGGLPFEPAHARGVAIGEIGCDRDPLPALPAKRLRLDLELLGHKAVEKRCVLQPAAVIKLEQVTQHDAAGRLIGFKTDELRPLIGGPDRTRRE